MASIKQLQQATKKALLQEPVLWTPSMMREDYKRRCLRNRADKEKEEKEKEKDLESTAPAADARRLERGARRTDPVRKDRRARERGRPTARATDRRGAQPLGHQLLDTPHTTVPVLDSEGQVIEFC